MPPSKKPRGTTHVTGARESWAGDDFHLLWASLKCLALLNPDSDLKAVAIEGSAPKDSSAVDPEGDQLLGIDLAEYLGGDNFQGATRVIHSQLKYSAKNSMEAWTAARLCEGKKGGTKGSVVHRLAQIFSAYLSEYGREPVLSRLSLKLVSNKPVHADLRRTLIDVRMALEAMPGEVSAGKLRDRLLDHARQDIDRFERATELGSSRLVDFLRVLNCDDCGVGSRYEQEESLLRFLGKLGREEVTSQYAQLINLVRKRTLPEFSGSPILMAHDIVPVFGFPSVDSFFPAKPRFATLKSVVTRTQAKEIAKVIIEHGNGPICLHAGAGYGKTTLARSLTSHLPTSSVMVVFDCYGGGSYLDPSEVRHTHNRAILQIANELAVRTGSPLLLLPEGRPEALLKALKDRLAVSVGAIQEQSPDGLVVIVVDAADNSIAAAESTGQASFVNDLVRCELPSGCRLVVTTRTHRRSQLGLPPTTTYCKLRRFEPFESMEHLRAYYAHANDQQVGEFHRLSNGLPRVQGYALENSQRGIESVLEALRPDGKTVEFLIDQKITEASRKLGGGNDAPNICRSLIALPRPIPTHYVAKLAGVDPGAVDGFCVDMWPGLRAGNGLISFRDEDFETHLSATFAVDELWKEKASDLLQSNAQTDAYAAIHLGNLLYSSRKFDVLRGLVLEEGLPAAIKDSLLRRDTFVKRARLALLATSDLNNRVLFLKLLLVAAEAAKTDEAVQRLVGENADLASKYGDPITVQRLFLHDKESGWYGPGHLRCAASFSRQHSTRDQAKEHLRSAGGWLRWWSILPDEERRTSALTVEDIAAGTEAIFRLYSREDAKRWLSSWRPKSTIYEAFKYASRTFFQTDSSQDTNDFFDQLLKVRADIALAAIEVGLKEGIGVPLTLLERQVAVWRRFSQRYKRPSDSLRSSGLYLIERITKLGKDSFGLLDWFIPSPPAYISLIGDDEHNTLDTFLRGRFLKAATAKATIDVESLYPTRLAASAEEADKKESSRLREDRERFKLAYSFLAPAYELRAGCIAGTIQPDQFATRLDRCLQNYSSDYQVRHRHDGHGLIQLFVETVLDVVLYNSPNRFEHLKWIEKRCAHERYGTIPLCFTLAEGTVSQPDLRHETLRYLKTAKEEIVSQQMSASEQVKHLVRCARISERVDKEAGRSYFEQAIKAASDIDQEAMDQLLCLSRLAERTVMDSPGARSPKSAYELSRYVETCYWRLLGWDHFPLADSLRAVTLLDPPSGLAALCRWDEEGVADIESEIVVVLDAMVSRGFLDPSDGCALTVLATPSDGRVTKSTLSFIDRMLRGASHDRVRARAALQQAVQDIFLHAPLPDRKYYCQKLNEWVAQRGLGGEEPARQAQALYVFLEQIERENKERSIETSGGPLHVESVTKEEKLGVDLDTILKGKTSWSAKEMEEAIRSLPSEPFGHRLIGELFERLKRECPPAKYRSQLEAILSIDPALLPFHSLIDAVRSRSTDWSVHPAVEEWKATALPDIVKHRFEEFLGHGRFSTYYLRQLEEALGLNEASSAASIVPVLPEYVEAMSAAALYQATQALASTLPSGEAIELLDWALARLLVTVKDTIAEGPWHVDLAPPSMPDEAISLFLWRMFGHPDKRIRWRAVHGVRRMIKLGSTRIAGALIGLRDKENCSPFHGKSTVFYMHSARLWLFVLLDRLAGEAPSLLLPQAEVIVREAIQPTIRHALIRHFVKATALRLAHSHPRLFTDKQHARLKKVLVSQYAMVKKTGWQAPRRAAGKSGKEEETSRFSFDPMDTLPYWYAPLGAVFGLSQNQIAKLAESFICDCWGYTGRVWDRDLLHKTRRYGYPLTSNGHGSEPTVEDLQTYLEYHAMFCVADQLLSTLPIVRDSWDRDPWDDWVRRWALTWEDSWLADERDPTPMEKMFWGLNRQRGIKGGKEWKSNIPAEHFDKVMGLTSPLHPGFLVLGASIYRHDGKDYESIHISSSLVSPDTAPALLRALHSARDPFVYGIPWEDDESEIKDDLGFELRGWIRNWHSSHGGIDEKDPLRNELDNGRKGPGKEFSKWANLQSSMDHRITYASGKPKQPLTIFEHWNDFRAARHESGFGTSGSRLWVRKSSLLEFLKSRKRCMIIKCSIDRHLDSSEEDWSVRSEKAKVVLIHENGKIETLS